MKQFIHTYSIISGFITVQAQQSYIKKENWLQMYLPRHWKNCWRVISKGSHRNVILISDTLLKRNSADVATRQKNSKWN